MKPLPTPFQPFNPRGVLGLLIGSLLAVACGSPKQFNFPAADWQRDRLGCTGRREALAGELEAIRRDLRGLTEPEILGLLGKPDAQALQGRGQKYFVYYLETGPQCDNARAVSQARTVAIRLNALGFVTELTYQRGQPR
ncbi:MAG: hypothetical protein H7Z75_12665 [Ferruginibacter sp.]|nr:hypothetical protein [Cytophagales bacterium]